MNIAVISLFRNASSYIQNYFDQLLIWNEQLKEFGHSLTPILGYGDSDDGTEEMLFEECKNLDYSILLDVSHGGPIYGSVVHPERFKQLSDSANRLWRLIPSDADVVALIESDLEWEPETMMALLRGLKLYQSAKSFGPKRFIISPLVLNKDRTFYDTWAFRKDKTHFQAQPPYHSKFHPKGRYSDMDSVGSCFFMTGNLKHLVSFPEKDVVVGLCRSAKENGAEIYIDRESKVYHP